MLMISNPNPPPIPQSPLPPSLLNHSGLANTIRVRVARALDTLEILAKISRRQLARRV